MQQLASKGEGDLRGTWLNREGGFEAAHNWQYICTAGMLPLSKEHPRHRQGHKRGRKRCGNDARQIISGKSCST